MPGKVTVHSHVFRALAFYNASNTFIGIAKSQPWASELAPPTPTTTEQNLGYISNQIYVGSSMTSSNCFARINTGIFTSGFRQYKINALTSSTYEVRDITFGLPGSLVGLSSYTTQLAARSNIITGLDITVSGTLVPSDSYQFNMDGPIGYKLVNSKQMVIPDPAGSISYNGSTWSVISPSNAYSLNSRWVYVQAQLIYTELPVGQYRQEGVFTELVRNVGVTAQAVLPSQISSVGQLHTVNNRGVVTRDSDSIQDINVIIEF